MLTIDQVKKKAPVMANMIETYAFRRLFYLKRGFFYPVYLEIGNKNREMSLSEDELKLIHSEDSLESFTEFINTLDDISEDEVFSDDKAIYDYVYSMSILPEFAEAKSLKLGT